METATFAGGCFWCTEAIFKMLKGVEEVTSGYSGGFTEKPSYEQVSSCSTGHAETIQITFNPKMISYETLVYVFLRSHDPTTPNRQGADVGSQYRSVIFYHNARQKSIASDLVTKSEMELKRKIVTQILPFGKFFKAEDYHQDFYAKNPGKPYCRLVIDPKITKLKTDFKKYLKK